MTPRARTPLCIALAAAFIAPSHAQAEGADDKTPGQQAVQSLDTVIVSATRRREPAREVPIVVNAVSALQLEKSGAASLSDFVGGLPGIDVKSNGGPGRGQVSIRGVSTGDQTIATVGMYVDDVAFGSNSAFVAGASSALDMSLLDLDHIELLRGPQGTLYGAGAMGGLIKYVTHEPDTAEFSGKASLGLRSTRHGGLGHTESAVVNVPLKEDIAGLRIAAFHDHDDGFIDAAGLAAGRRVNSGNTTGGRLSLLLEPSSKFKVRLTGTAQNLTRGGLNYVNYDMATGRPVDGELTRPLATREPYEVRVRLGSLDLEYNLGWARFNAITSVQRLDARTAQDTTFIFGPVLSQQIGVPVDAVNLHNTPRLRKTTQEFRLTSSRGDLEWLAGFYYDKERGNFDQLLTGRFAADGSVFDAFTIEQPSRYEEIAAYGDLTYNIAKRWSFTAGVRVARNQQAFSAVNDGVADPEVRSKDHSNTYLGTLRYALTPVSNVYVRAASGYRPGGPNQVALGADGKPVPGAPTSFQPDTLWSYELGYKADLLDRTLAVEASLYDIRWKDIQQHMAVGATTINTNAGRAHIQGFEASARWQASPSWTLEGSLSAVDAQLSEASALGPSGTLLPNTAKFSATLGASHRFEAFGHPSYAGATIRHVGRRNAGFDVPGSSLPNFVLPASTQIDLQGGMEFGRFDLAVFARNLTDKRALLGANTALVAFGAPLQATLAQPRTLGATATVKF